MGIYIRGPVSTYIRHIALLEHQAGAHKMFKIRKCPQTKKGELLGQKLPLLLHEGKIRELLTSLTLLQFIAGDVG